MPDVSGALRIRPIAAAVGAAIGLLTLVGGGPPPDIRLDITRASASAAPSVHFELGTNELFDLFVDGGVRRARQIGADRIRVWLGHRFLGTAVRSAEPSDFDWDALYRYVERVLESGAVPHVSFVAAPAWVPAFDGRPSSQHESEGFDDVGARAYGDYVAEAIARLNARFGAPALDWPFVIWNEPNNHQNAGVRYACGDGDAYARLFQATRRAVDARFGEGRIALGGPSLDAIDTGATFGADGLRACGDAPDLGWRSYLDAVDTAVGFDFLTWHWYGMFALDETTPQEVLLTRLAWFEDRVRQITQLAAGRPHFVEEININGSLEADPLVNAQVNAAFTASAMLRAIRQGAAGMLMYKGARAADGAAPGGGPDFGLWSNESGGDVTPAFHALRLLRRFVGDGGRLLRLDLGPPDIDALALESESGRLLAVVNLRDAPRDVVIEGVPAGPFVASDAASPWRSGWFDGQTLSMQAHAVAVIGSGSLGLAPLPAPQRGADRLQSSAGGPACADCHGAGGQGMPAGLLAPDRLGNLASAHPDLRLTAREQAEIADYLTGSGGPDDVYAGVVRDRGGDAVAGAVVLAGGVRTARIASTDGDGHFTVRAPRGDASPDGVPARFSVVSPAHLTADRPSRIAPAEPGSTELGFDLTPLSGQARPLIATPHVVPSEIQGLWKIGLATGGDDLVVWALDMHAGVARRLDPVAGHAFGLHQIYYGASGPPPDRRTWRFVAIAADGVPSQLLELAPEATPEV